MGLHFDRYILICMKDQFFYFIRKLLRIIHGTSWINICPIYFVTDKVDKAQLIALLQKQTTINVIGVIDGKSASLDEKICSLNEQNLTLIIIKSR